MPEDVSETRLDIETARAESQNLLDNLPNIKDKFDRQSEKKLPVNSPFWYEVGSQYEDQFKKTKPEIYEAIMAVKKAVNSIAGREGEKMAKHLTSKMNAELSEKTREIDLRTDPEMLAGAAVGEVARGTNLDIQTKVDLFQYGVGAIVESTSDLSISFSFDKTLANQKQDKFEEAESQVNSPSLSSNDNPVIK